MEQREGAHWGFIKFVGAQQHGERTAHEIR